MDNGRFLAQIGMLTQRISPTRQQVGKNRTYYESTPILDSLRQIAAKKADLQAPQEWMIIDSPLLTSYTIGNTVYLTRGLVESDHLTAAMVYELGHIAVGDGVLLLSLRRLVRPIAFYVGIDRSPTPAGSVAGSVGGVGHQRVEHSDDEKLYYRFHALRARFFLALVFGGFGLLFLARQWAHVWRDRAFEADDFVSAVGFEQEFIELLSMQRGLDFAVPYYLSGRPYTAERIDRLRG